MHPDGLGWLYAPTGLVDGPLPTHYEPHESPVDNPLYDVRREPDAPAPRRDETNPYHPSGSDPGADVFPFVMTTYRLTEHHTAGGMSRTVPYLSELQPEMFVEVSPELAAERGLEHGGWATIVTARTAIEARVLVTDRMRPLSVDGRTLHQVGLPYHWGRKGLSHRRRGQRAALRRCSTSTCTSPSTRRRPATSGPAGGRAGRAGVARGGLPRSSGRHYESRHDSRGGGVGDAD